MSFDKKLDTIIYKNNSLLCVGLDSDIEKIPEHLKKSETPQFDFNRAIIDQTHDLVCAYKPNPAFYEARGEQGIRELKQTCDYINETYPEIPIVIDAKRGDIGNTNKGYAKFVFEYLQADAITVIPYLGIEALSAYFDYTDKGIIVGCHSSNPGAKEFQELKIDNTPLYEIVAKNLVEQYGSSPNTMMFMGATYPEQLTEIRKIVGDMTLLVPGVGSQGADAKATVTAGLNSKKTGMMINASRSIIFAGSDEDFATMAQTAATKLRDEINEYRK
jgi:orotidine-5'-phosphate decarboxylase